MNFESNIIVVGASAGGFIALPNLLQNLPTDIPAALFVVLHIPMQPDDLLAALIQRKTTLKVHTALDDQEITAGHVYIAPPDQHLLIDGSRIRLSHGPRENRHRPAIDPLFRSAAKFHGQRVIGLLLTGHLDDGVAGLNAVKTHGGIAMVQSPEEAITSELVHNALRNVQVDYCLPVAELSNRLRELVSTAAKPAALVTHDGVTTDPPMGLENMMGSIGSPVPYTCPECHGALWENKTSGVTEYRCHVGHAYSPEALLIDQDYNLERALWSAIRTFEEQANLLQRLAKRDVQGPLLAKWTARAEQSRKNADAIRALLQARH